MNMPVKQLNYMRSCGKFSEKPVDYWLEARKYVKVLIAIDEEDRVLGKVTLDLAYKPYAEIANLMVIQTSGPLFRL